MRSGDRSRDVATARIDGIDPAARGAEARQNDLEAPGLDFTRRPRSRQMGDAESRNRGTQGERHDVDCDPALDRH